MKRPKSTTPTNNPFINPPQPQPPILPIPHLLWHWQPQPDWHFFEASSCEFSIYNSFKFDGSTGPLRQDTYSSQEEEMAVLSGFEAYSYQSDFDKPRFDRSLEWIALSVLYPRMTPGIRPQAAWIESGEVFSYPFVLPVIRSSIIKKYRLGVSPGLYSLSTHKPSSIPKSQPFTEWAW